MRNLWHAAAAAILLLAAATTASADTITYTADAIGKSLTHEQGIGYAPAAQIVQVNGQNAALVSSGCSSGVEECKARITLAFDQCYSSVTLDVVPTATLSAVFSGWTLTGNDAKGSTIATPAMPAMTPGVPVSITASAPAGDPLAALIFRATTPGGDFQILDIQATPAKCAEGFAIYRSGKDAFTNFNAQSGAYDLHFKLVTSAHFDGDITLAATGPKQATFDMPVPSHYSGNANEEHTVHVVFSTTGAAGVDVTGTSPSDSTSANHSVHWDVNTPVAQHLRLTGIEVNPLVQRLGMPTIDSIRHSIYSWDDPENPGNTLNGVDIATGRSFVVRVFADFSLQSLFVGHAISDPPPVTLTVTEDNGTKHGPFLPSFTPTLDFGDGRVSTAQRLQSTSAYVFNIPPIYTGETHLRFEAKLTPYNNGGSLTSDNSIVQCSADPSCQSDLRLSLDGVPIRSTLDYFPFYLIEMRYHDGVLQDPIGFTDPATGTYHPGALDYAFQTFPVRDGMIDFETSYNGLMDISGIIDGGAADAGDLLKLIQLLPSGSVSNSLSSLVQSAQDFAYGLAINAAIGGYLADQNAAGAGFVNFAFLDAQVGASNNIRPFAVSMCTGFPSCNWDTWDFGFSCLASDSTCNSQVVPPVDCCNSSVTYTARPLTLAAHELNHIFGRKHADHDCGGSDLIAGGAEPWEDSRGDLHGIGIDTLPGIHPTKGPRVIQPERLGTDKAGNPLPKEMADYMSYCAGSQDAGTWISPHGWEELLNEFNNAVLNNCSPIGYTLLPFAPDDVQPMNCSDLKVGSFYKRTFLLPPKRPGNYLLLSAILDNSKTPFHLTGAMPHDYQKIYHGPDSGFSAVLLDATGNIVATGKFYKANFASDLGVIPAHADIEAPDNATKLVIVKDSAPSKSPGAQGENLSPKPALDKPVDVKLIGPQPPAISDFTAKLDARQTNVDLQWKAAGAVNPGSWVAIDLIEDGAAPRRLFLGPWRTALSLPVTRFFAGPRALRVRLTDGYRVSDKTIPLELPHRAPFVRIASPRGKQTYALNATATFVAAAMDDQGGRLPESAYVWTIDGHPASQGGHSFGEAMKAPGHHIVRASVTDGLGNTGFAEIGVDVLR